MEIHYFVAKLQKTDILKEFEHKYSSWVNCFPRHGLLN